MLVRIHERDTGPHREYEAQLRTMLAEYGLEDIVRLPGLRTDVPDLFEAADIAIHASEMFTDTDRPLLETVVFSAKESIHKTLFPQSGIWLDFLDVELRIDPEEGIFHPQPAPEARATDPRLGERRGRFSVGAGFVITVGSLGRPSSLA